MSVENKDVIDYISVENGKKVLSISDHLPWGNVTHLYVLQEKINMYLSAIETRQILNYYPDATKGYIICLYLKYEPDEQGKSFLQRVNTFLNKSGYEFKYIVLEDSF